MVRGNLTSVTKYTDAVNRNGALTDHLIYDITGNVVSQTAAGGISQTFTYTQDTQNAYCVASTFGSLSSVVAKPD